MRVRAALTKTLKLGQILAEPSYRQALLRTGVAATTEHRNVVFPREYGTIIDVGANRGQFALFALHRFPGARIYCFEPGPDAYPKLLSVVGKKARTRQVAVGAAEGTMRLNVAHTDDSSSLLQPTTLQTTTFPGTGAARSMDVDVKPLDALLDPASIATPFLLKVDVQGYEHEVIGGAPGLLATDGDLLIECSFAELYAGQALADEVIATLLPLGYRLRGVYSVVSGSDGPLQGDFLFSRCSPNNSSETTA
jgi:FkbM family methyltransferase